jgi:intracellular sulfur oxidation DsrE/DsrF family protein
MLMSDSRALGAGRIGMIKILLYVLAGVCLYATNGVSDEATIKAVMQINSQNLAIVERGLRNALDISDTAKSEGRHLDLKLVVFGPAVDLFIAGTDRELKGYFTKLTASGNVQFFVDDRRLKKIGRNVSSLLPGFKTVSSGGYEVLRLESEGYLYIKP